MNKKLLVPTAGVTPANDSAQYIMEVAKALSADVIALHVVRPNQAAEPGELCLEIFAQAGKVANVSTECHIRRGAVLDEIIEFAEENQVDVIVMGASHGAVVDQWLSSEICSQTKTPVLVIPYQIFEA